MKIQNSKFKVQSCLKKLFTIHYSLFTEKGFTLIEIIMIIVIVSIAIPALLFIVAEGTKQGVDAELRVTAINVAQQLLEEIKTKCFDETSVSGTTCIQTAAASTTLGPEAGEVMLSLYNDVDDFNDLAPASLGTPPCTDTFPINNVSFTRAVDVCYVTGVPPTPDLNTCLGSKSGCTWTGATPTDYKKITVTVTAPSSSGGGSVTLTTLVTNY